MSDQPNQQVPEEVLRLATSPTVTDRIEAGPRLAPFAGQPDADALLHRLLLDGVNTSIAFETAEALLARKDLAGAQVLALAIAEIDLRDLAAAWIGDAIYGEWMMRQETIDLGQRLCESLLHSDSDLIRQGASFLAFYLDHAAWPDTPAAPQPQRPGLLSRALSRLRF